jgi:hypothetical protein
VVQGNVGFIDYLSRANADPLILLPDGPETFSDLVRILSSYEGMSTLRLVAVSPAPNSRQASLRDTKASRPVWAPN